ncbi:MAG: hypothetical protein ABSC47_02380 [Terracidiphilus sp.]|jgi:hypothetical protein
MIAQIEPWRKYPDLTQPRLTILANEIRRVRSECVALHEPEHGDGDWSLGCRVYQRTFFAIRELSKTLDWLSINQELKALQFSFSVGSVPLRHYKGDPDDPPSRYLTHSDGETLHIQTCFEFEGLPTVDTILRLAVDVDSTRQATSVSLVEIDEYKEVIGQYRIPFTAQISNISLMQAPPVNLPPVVAEPIKKETDEEKIRGNPANVIAS